ncbi:EAL domain-containing protein [Photobacterium kishitanii]|uniref:EAL domain-containing protein n=1 Tax=Photobacterium kishitanii TaxID=318456 RepID=UPI0027396103|nr:EAL domain-containing protein [Photobacterium kishitanii]
MKASILHCISLRSSTLQHKDFINHISSNKYKSKYKNVVLLLQANEPYQSNSVCFMSNFTLLKSMFAGVILDGFGNGSASLSLLDLFDFDGIKVHSIFKELIDRPGKSKLLIEIIINELVKDGKTIFFTISTL